MSKKETQLIGDTIEVILLVLAQVAVIAACIKYLFS